MIENTIITKNAIPIKTNTMKMAALLTIAKLIEVDDD
jgi:hypothetical protein